MTVDHHADDLHRLGRAMDRARTVITSGAQVIEECLGLPASHLTTMKAIADGARTVSDAATACMAHVSTASRVVDQLVQADLVSRRTDPDDRRAVILELTTAGRELMDTLHGLRNDMLATAATRLGDDRGRFIDLLEAFVDGMADAVTAGTRALDEDTSHT